MTNGADDNANDLMASLTTGVSFPLPAVNLDDPVYDLPDGSVVPAPVALTNAALTEKTVGGDGTFDVVMSGIKAHLQDEYTKGRVTGAEYVKAYIELTQAALGNAVQFLLGRDAAYYQALAAQFAAKQAEVTMVTSRVQLAIAKAQLQALQYEVETKKADFALTKIKLATEDIAFGVANYNLMNIQPKQLALLNEQIESARAQTSNTRVDGVTPIQGVMGKQRDLYDQQITSYKRDGEVKAMKLFTDAWITQKTIDEGLLAPDAFTNASLNAMLEDIKTNNNLGV